MANKNTKEALYFVVQLSKAVTSSLSDGKIDILDGLKFFGALQSVGPALKDAQLIPQEFASMSAVEKAEVVALIGQIDLPNDQVEAWIENALKLAVMLGSLVGPIKV